MKRVEKESELRRWPQFFCAIKVDEVGELPQIKKPA